jgi:hypothetical protein
MKIILAIEELLFGALWPKDERARGNPTPDLDFFEWRESTRFRHGRA